MDNNGSMMNIKGHLVGSQVQSPFSPIHHKTTAKKARIEILKLSLISITEATGKQDPSARAQSIADFNLNLREALRVATAAQIRKICETAYLKCLVACLQQITRSVIDGTSQNCLPGSSATPRIELFNDWYEEDRQRMIEAGFRAFSVDARADTRAWKEVR